MNHTGRFADIRSQLHELTGVTSSPENNEKTGINPDDRPIVRPYQVIVKKAEEKFGEAESLLDDKDRIIELLRAENIALKENVFQLKRRVPRRAAGKAPEAAKEVRLQLQRTKERLAASEGRYRALVDNAQVGVYHNKLDGTILYVNEAFARLLEYDSAEDVMQHRIEELYHNPGDRRRLLDTLREKGSVHDYPVQARTRTGKVLQVLLGVTLVGDETIGTLQDVTQLRERERRFRTLAENSPDVIARFDRQLRHVYLNPYGARVYGVPQEQVIGKTNADLGMPAEKVAFWKQHFEDVFANGRQRTVEFDYDSPNMGHQHFLSVFVPECNERGEVETILAITRDVSNLKETETALRRSEEFDKRILESSLNGLYIFDVERKMIIFANRQYTSLTGYSTEELNRMKGPEFLSLFHPDDQARVSAHIESVQQSEDDAPREIEYRFRRRDGRWIWCLSRETVFTRSKDGNVVQYIGTFIDITERKQAEEALQESQNRLQSVLENSFDAVYRRDLRNDHYDYISPAIERITGYTVEEFTHLGLTTVFEMIHPDDAKQVNQTLELIMTGGSSSAVIEYRLKGKDGQYRWVADHAAVVNAADGTPVYRVGAVRDITRKKQLELALRREQELLRTIIDTIPVMITIYEPDVQRVLVNRALEELTGWTQQEFDRGNIMTMAYPDPQYRQMVTGYMQSLTPGWRDFTMTTRDGSRIETSWANVRLPDGRQVGIGIDISERKRAEDVLRASEERYRRLFTSMSEGFALGEAIADDTGEPKDFCFLELNDAFMRQTGLSRDIIGKPMTMALPNLEHYWVDTYVRVAMTGEPVRFENYNKDTDRHYDVYCYSPARGRFAILFRDVTRERMAEQALRKSEERWNLAIEAFTEGAIIATEDEHVIYWNPAARELHGFTSENEGVVPLEETSNTFQLWTPDGSHMLELDEWPMRRIKRGESVHGYELRLRRPDQNWEKFISYSGSMVETTDGERLIFLSVHDLTEQRESERALRESEERYRELVQSANSAIVRWKSDGTISFFNEYAQEFFGYQADEITGKHIGIIVPERESSGEDLTTLVQEIVRHPERYRNNVNENIRKDGSRVWMMWTNKPVFDKNGRVKEVFAIGNDITEQKKAQDALRESEERYRELVQSANSAIIRWKSDGTISFFNEYAQVFFGYRADEIVGKDLNIIIPAQETSGKDLTILVSDVAESPEKYRININENIRRDGSRIWMMWTNSPVVDNNGNVIEILSVGNDITERKRIEEALRESEEKFRTMADNISQFAWMADEKGWIFWYNKRWYDYTGTTLEEMQGWGWQKVLHPDHVERVVSKIQHSWDTGEVWEDTFPLRGRDGEYRWFLSRAIPIRDEQGKIIRWFGTNTDITELRQTQESLEQLTEQLDSRVQERTAQLEALNLELEGIAYSLSHDLRTPLRAIDGFNYLLMEEYGDKLDEEARSYLERARAAAQKAWYQMDSVLDLLKMTRVDIKKEEVDLSEIARTFVSDYQSGHPNQKVEVSVQPGVTAYGNEGLLSIVVQNLLDNAFKFSQKKEDPKVAFGAYNGEGETIYYVRDNGVGFNMQFSGKLFQIFQRLHVNDFKGIGVGLASVRHIVLKHGGRIWAEGEEGKGATFYFTLG